MLAGSRPGVGTAVCEVQMGGVQPRRMCATRCVCISRFVASVALPHSITYMRACAYATLG